MNRIFDMDGPLMTFLGRAGDLIWLNILTLVCCIPVVTAGAAFTALHYVSLKLVRNEEGYITRSYFKSFRQNLRQSTIIWVFMVLLGAGIMGDLYILGTLKSSTAIFVLRVALCAITLIMALAGIYIFPILSHFQNSIRNTVKNAFLLCVLKLPFTILIFVIYMLFLLVWIVFFFRMVPVIFLCGISLPVYLNTMIFSKIFKKMELENENRQSV